MLAFWDAFCYQEKGDADDSSTNSLLGSSPSITDCSHSNAWPPRQRTSGRKRASTTFSFSGDEMGHSLSTIKDENSTSPRDPAPAPGASSPVVTGVTDNVDYKREDDVFEVTRSSSELFLHAALLQTPMGSRRCRSATYSGPASDESTGRHVTNLDLSNNKIRNLDKLVAEGKPNLLNRFTLLEKIDLSQNILENMPDGLLKQLVNLQHLNLSQNHILDLPTTALGCRQLTNLNLSNNQIERIDLLGIGINVSIKELDLSHNSLEDFPNCLAKIMPNLESLILHGNKIKLLPSEPLILRSLILLNLAHNSIKEIPDLFLTQTPILETLILTGNEIDVLPSEEVAMILPKLAVVKLAHNNIAIKEPFFIPKFLLELEGLRSIVLDQNQLLGLPEPNLWKATSLREIYASHNEIKKLNLGSQPRPWAGLERLTISHNKLAELTKDIGNLTSLTSLDISHNEKLFNIPDEMGRLQKLWEFPLDGLKLDLDEGLLKGRTKDLVGYLHEKLKRSVEYYHMKMMVVGYGGRGKSTLLRALRKQKQLEKSIPTVGVVVRDWKFRVRGRRPGIGHVTYTISTWDFAGQEEFYATHQCFLSNRALYLVVYNLAKGVSEVEKLRPWLLNIQARAPNCPVIVVGTHLDNIPKEEKESAVNETRQRITEMCDGPGWPLLKGLTEVNSTQEGSAMERLRVLIKDVLDNFKINGQPAMGQKIPASYVRLQELLSEEARNLRTSLPIIKHPRLLKIAKDAELALDEDELHQAVRFLHESGSLLHYDDAALQLNSYYFIDPEWLCRMMAQVVTVREINPFITPEGILKREHVHYLFTGKRVGVDLPYTFPAYLIPQYLKLLEKFEIALPQNDDELLIPSRLPVQRPVFRNPLPAFDRSINQYKGYTPDSAHMYIERRYELSYTPIGLWSRLLTRLLVFINTLLPGLDLGRQEPVETQYWRQGIYVYYGLNAYFLVASDQLVAKSIVVRVPSTRLGSRLLGELVDHIDALIEEWYPGLHEVLPTGERLVRRKAPCPGCNDYVFELEDLISQSDLNDCTECPVHKGSVPLSTVAPDIVLGDMEEKYKLNMEDFVFVQSPEYVLGDGTFGCVYRAKYKNQGVAVKLYNFLGEGPPYKMMRQEAGILRRLNHPSLICMLGVGLHPRVLLLELAPLGALGSLLKSKRGISRSLQHRIATQVADGLKFIHEQNIVYRDMKPDNILIFNPSLTVVINAKISDYGISRLATAYGLTLPEGTPGYRSPEVIRGEPYSFQADIYSFGVTMYELVTGGQHPFSDLNFRSEVDDAILKGRRVEPVTKRGATPWPDMEDVIDHCLCPIPEHRPTSAQLLDQLRCVDFLCLKRTVAVSKGMSVECMAVRGYGESDLEVWVASGDKDGAQLSWLSLTTHTHEPKGMLLTGSRILSISTVGQSSMLLGSQNGTVCVYDAWQHTCKHTLPALSDSVLCLQHYTGYQDHDYIFAGLANGKLAVFHTNDVLSAGEAPCYTLHGEGSLGDPVPALRLLPITSHNIIIRKDPATQPRYLQIATGTEPIRVLHLEQKSKRLYLGAGAKVHVVRVEPHLDIEESFNTNKSGGARELISALIVTGKHAHIAKKGRSTIELWHLSKHELLKQKDISYFSNRSVTNRDARVTSMILVNKSTLWIGTGDGAILLIDTTTYDHLVTLNRHASSVRCLAWARVFDQFSLVLSGGLGFSYGSHDADTTVESDHGFLLLWDTDIPHQLRTLRDYDKRRQEWIDHNCQEMVEKASVSQDDKPMTSGNTNDLVQGGKNLRRSSSEKPRSKQDMNQKGAHLAESRYNRSQSLYQRHTRKTSIKRSPLTPNLEFGRLKKDSLIPVNVEAGKLKRKSAQTHESNSPRNRKKSTPTETLEIGKLLQTRKQGSGALRKQSWHSVDHRFGENINHRRASSVPIPASIMGGKPSSIYQNEPLCDLKEDTISDGNEVMNRPATNAPHFSKRTRHRSIGGSPSRTAGAANGRYSFGSSPGALDPKENHRRSRKNSRGRVRKESGGDGAGTGKRSLSENNN